MPNILRIRGYKFYFYANERREPPHIHVDKGGATAKLWLSPLRWENSYGFSAGQTNYRANNSATSHRAHAAME